LFYSVRFEGDRGQAYAGLFVFDPAHRDASLEKGEGLADDIFKPLGHLNGDVGIAHTRYKTYGSGGTNNAQPFFDPFSAIALAHNGHITNVPQIEAELEERGQGLSATCDADAMLRMLSLWVEHFRRQDPGAEEKEILFRAIEETQRWWSRPQAGSTLSATRTASGRWSSAAGRVPSETP